MAISSLLTYDSWFGLSLPAFLLLLIWTLSVFQLQQAAVAAAGRDTAAAGEQPAALWLGRSTATRTAQVDDQHRWVTLRFIASTLSGTWLSFMLAAAFFLLIPRVWPNTNPIFTDGGRPIGGAPSRTGYTNHIALGDVGEIQESTRVALKARLTDSETGARLPWTDWLATTAELDYRFRGGAQEIYDDGVWQRWEGAEGSLRRFEQFPRLVSGGARQEVTLYHESSGDDADVLLSFGLPLQCQPMDANLPVFLEPFSWAMNAGANETLRGERTYSVMVVPWEPWFPNWEGRLIPFRRGERRSSQAYFQATLQLDRSLHDALVTWIAEHPDLSPKSASHHALARHWEQWFRQQTELAYSLNMAIFDPHLDPVVDFLRNTRRGHCEYFASALALLLRTQGIPARVVSGYKGGQLADDETVIVRDLHAHLWVEAFLEDAPDNPATGQTGPRWMMLDPTPGLRESMVQAQEKQSTSTYGQLRQAWMNLWSRSIRMNRGDQQDLVYSPLSEVAEGLFGELRDGFRERGLLGLPRLLMSPRRWFSWVGGVTVFVLLIAAVFFAVSVRHFSEWLGRRRRAGSVAIAAAPVIPFYARFESLLERHNFRRNSAQTPREFASATGPALATRTPPQLSTVPAELTEEFYAVRFGGQTLTSERLGEVAGQLDQLKRELDADALRHASPLTRRK